MRGRGNAAYRWICATVAALAKGVAYSASVGAQEISAEGRAELEALFDEILKNPTDLDLTYKYAQEATRLGDYEAAITAYERLLLFNPELPRVKAELGVLYYRLGSFDTSRAYLQEALASDPPAAARERIEGFLARIDASKRRHSFSGSASAGMR
ncbi:MAG: tetratricopeptide repeat protein [Alphaproteobacteria bacterium]